jgi:hypothetical protein
MISNPARKWLKDLQGFQRGQKIGKLFAAKRWIWRNSLSDELLNRMGEGISDRE